MTARVRGQRRTAAHRQPRSCPTCAYMPTAAEEIAAQRLDLQVLWLAEEPDHPDRLAVGRFCAQCQPRGAVYVLACRACGDGPMLTGALAETAMGGDLPGVVVDALAERGWRPARDRSGWVCCQ